MVFGVQEGGWAQDLCLCVAESGSEVAYVGDDLRGKGGREQRGANAWACGAGGGDDV